MKACQGAAQFLKVIAGRRPQVPIRLRIVDHLELAEEPAFEVGRDSRRPFIFNEEGAEPLVPKACDHAVIPIVYSCTTLWYKRQPPTEEAARFARGSEAP